MDRNDQDRIAKIICYGLGCVIAYYIFLWLLPYMAAVLALYAFGYLIIHANRNDRR